jgi:exodeoxyribonuclease-3
MKIATWNVNGIRARHREMVQWAAVERPDVLCLQELKATPEQIPDPLYTLPDYFSLWHGGPKGYSGVSLHVRRDFVRERPVFEHPPFDHENRMVSARLATAHGRTGPTGPIALRVVSVYVPNGGKDYPAKLSFLRELEAYVAAVQADGEMLVVCGDLNVARSEMDVHPKERKAGAIGQRVEERQLIEKLLERGGLVDVGRALAPDDDSLFTWWAPWRNMRERNIGWRLDYVLASGSLAARASSCASRREVGTSDHGPVVAEFT